MKKTYLVAFALALIAFFAFTFDAHAATLLIAPIAAIDLESISKALGEHGDAIKQFRDNQEEKQGEMVQRIGNLEQAVAKGLKTLQASNDTGATIDIKGIVEDPAFEDLRNGVKGSARQFKLGPVSLKALINLTTDDVTSSGNVFPTPADRLPGRLAQPLTPLRLIEVLPSRPVTSNKVEYTQLSPSGDAGVQVDEGDEKAEIEFEGELVTADVATVAVHTTASAQVLDDNAALQNLLERVMRNKVLAKAEEQLMTGSGLAGYVNGLNTQALWLDTNQDGIPERIGSALVTMETAGYAPDVILMHPNDWFAVSILKDADGNYIYGNPASPARPSLWNRPVITSPKVTQGRALVGDSSQVTVLDRMAPTVFISRDHKDYRTRNLVLILVEMRLGLELYDNRGFRKIDLGASG